MPAEWTEHEGTWLQWPHDYTYGAGTRTYFENAWIEMTRQLVKGEYVHIIAYNSTEQAHIETVLTGAGVSLDSVDFYIHPTNDYWVRDNGPVFITDQDDYLYATDWGFNGWGNDAPYGLCDQIPTLIAEDKGLPVFDLSEVILEGGAVEHDGNGTFIGTISSILEDGRNPGMTTADMESYFSEYFGFSNFIWLEGNYGGGFDITDSHIDGFLKFHDENTIVTMGNGDLAYWLVNAADRTAINNATNKNGDPYNYVHLPLTENKVYTEDGINTHSKGSYVNYYVGNAVVLVPIYQDENDSIALAILQDLMPDKEVVGIDCRNMFSWGGMVHCVVQQQPAVCSRPRNLVLSGLTSTTATITWDEIPAVTNFKVSRKLIGGGISNFNIAGNSITFTGLIPGSTYKAMVKSNCDGSFSNKSDIITIHTPLRAGNNQTELVVFPNPANDQLHVKSIEIPDYAELIGLDGRTIAIPFTDYETVINTAELPAGMYVLKLFLKSGIINESVVIEH